MKTPLFTASLLLPFCLLISAQNPDTATIPPVAPQPFAADADSGAVSLPADTPGTTLLAADSGVVPADSISPAPDTEDAFVNPFAGESTPAADTTDYSSNPFHNPAMHKTGIMTGIGSNKPLLDLLLDISMGYSLSRFSTGSPLYSSQSKGDLLFNIGVIFPIQELFYVEIAFRNTQIKYGISDSTADMQGSYFTTRAEESMNFISLPIHVGMKFDRGVVSPYCYASCEGALLTASHQLVKRKSYSFFLPDSAVYVISSVQDEETTGKRARYQVFAGGGIGIEISYGYGVVYLDGGIRAALLETGYRDFPPSETASVLMVFPFSFGLRFYL
ncbi:MAG: hypothetical protein JXA71_13145 [Chitinispirillaceae bacterium]|nr:hypothetical protein [Chitinispirillaceae bacterium]